MSRAVVVRCHLGVQSFEVSAEAGESASLGVHSHGCWQEASVLATQTSPYIGLLKHPQHGSSLS